MYTTRSAGKLGENFAAEYLRKKGYKILQRNFHTKFGEIDIIALDGKTLVFIEVKTRWSKEFGYPEESVTPKKIRHLIKAAWYYKLMNPQTPELMRIDVVATEVEDRMVREVRLIRNVTGL